MAPQANNKVRIPPPIFIIGMRGVGKTTLSKYVSNKLSWNHIDVDQKLAELGLIFSEDNATRFRQRERELMFEYIFCWSQYAPSSGINGSSYVKGPTIISCGGGIVESVETCYNLRNYTGPVIYLKSNRKEILCDVKAVTDFERRKDKYERCATHILELPDNLEESQILLLNLIHKFAIFKLNID